VPGLMTVQQATDAYAALGLQKEAASLSPADLRKAYLRCALALHKDFAPVAPASVKPSKTFVESREAFEVLRGDQAGAPPFQPEDLVPTMRLQGAQDTFGMCSASGALYAEVVGSEDMGNKYTNYIVRVAYSTRRWLVTHRFSDFLKLHKQVCEEVPALAASAVGPELSEVLPLPDLPTKTGAFKDNRHPALVEERSAKFSAYLIALTRALTIMGIYVECVHDFLSLGEDEVLKIHREDIRDFHQEIVSWGIPRATNVAYVFAVEKSWFEHFETFITQGGEYPNPINNAGLVSRESLMQENQDSVIGGGENVRVGGLRKDAVEGKDFVWVSIGMWKLITLVYGNIGFEIKEQAGLIQQFQKFFVK